MTETVGAAKGERTSERLGYRAGYYGRTLVTRVGKLELRVPQDREGRFSTELFERYQRSERALVAALAEMYVQGVSTRKVKAITEELCGHSFSASSISAINKRLDASLAQFAGRSARGGLSLPDPGCPLRAGPRGRGDPQPGGADRGGGRLGRPAQRAGGRARQPGEPVELARLPARAEGARPARGRVRGGRRPCRAQGGAARGPGGGGLPALLRALPAQRPRLCAAQGRRRLPAGAALALRPARSRRSQAGSRGLAGEVAGASTRS